MPKVQKRSRLRLNLPNGCWCSHPEVSPKNWNSKGASTDQDWFIQYRFYDPKILDPKTGMPKGHQIRAKGMNEYKDLTTRRQICKALIKNEIERLQFLAYHPVRGRFIPEIKSHLEITPNTPFIDALWFAYDKLDCVKETKYDIKSILKSVQGAAKLMDISNRPVELITRKYFVAMFEKIRSLNKRFSPNRQNMYRAYLIKLYKILIEYEAVDINPLRDIEKKRVVKKKRLTTTLEERIAIDNYLHKNHYRYWRFMHLFFAGGARITEMMELQGKHVDLAGQRFMTTTKKGASHREVMHTIKTNVLYLWKEAMDGCGQNDFVFGYDLKPCATQVKADSINKKWRKWVKNSKTEPLKSMKIKADFYSLKHTHTSQISRLSGEEIAAGHDGHTTTAMVRSIYNYDREEQIHKAVKDLPNTLTGS